MTLTPNYTGRYNGLDASRMLPGTLLESENKAGSIYMVTYAGLLEFNDGKVGALFTFLTVDTKRLFLSRAKLTISN